MGQKENQARLTIYHLSSVSELESVIREEYRKERSISIEPIKVGKYSGFCASRIFEAKSPRWVGVYEKLTNLEIGAKSQASGAVIVLRRADSGVEGVDERGEGSDGASQEEKVWAITFGLGFQFIDPNCICRGFGKRIAIRSVDSSAMTALTSVSLDTRPRMQRNAIASGGELPEFGFSGIGDMALRVEGGLKDTQLKGKGRGRKIIGADGVNLPLEISRPRLEGVLDYLGKLLDTDPVDQRLASLEYLEEVREKSLCSRLNTMLSSHLKAVLQKDLKVSKGELFDVTYPSEIINDSARITSYRITGDRKRRGECDGLPSKEILLEVLKGVNEERYIERLRKLKVTLFDDDGIFGTRTSLIDWVAFQAIVDGKRYLLHNGEWYVISSSYMDRVINDVREIFSRDLPSAIPKIPDWTVDLDADGSENAYNVKLAEALGGVCLDGKLICPPDGRTSIEGCDVLLPDGVFIHVKKVESSAPVSHLIAQALVSTELLFFEEDARAQLKKHAEAIIGDISDYSFIPREVLILLARDDREMTADDLFTFSQVNLVKQVRNLDQRQVRVCVVPVMRKKHAE